MIDGAERHHRTGADSPTRNLPFPLSFNSLHDPRIRRLRQGCGLTPEIAKVEPTPRGGTVPLYLASAASDSHAVAVFIKNPKSTFLTISPPSAIFRSRKIPQKILETSSVFNSLTQAKGFRCASAIYIMILRMSSYDEGRRPESTARVPVDFFLQRTRIGGHEIHRATSPSNHHPRSALLDRQGCEYLPSMARELGTLGIRRW